MPDVASPLIDLKPAPVNPPEYSPEDERYLGALANRIVNAWNQRTQKWDFLDGMTYDQYYWENEKAANTMMQPRTNAEDSSFQSGTTRNKLFAIQAPLESLDLSPNILAFDEHDMVVHSIGEAIEDAHEKTAELENDAEKKSRRQHELLKQGDVFVEDLWEDVFKKDKVPQQKKAFDGTVKGYSWTTKLKRLMSRPNRKIICGLNVYLGDLTVYDVSEQPYLFTVEEMSYAQAESKFGKWERWTSVPRDIRRWTATDTATMRSFTWGLGDTQQKDRVQVVRYQDRWANEFAVILNGVLMTPVGLPLPWGFAEYSIVQQGYEPLHEKFAYHGSLPKRIKNNVALYDETSKVLILKMQKSAVEPVINLSGRILSRRIFMPGAITSGLRQGDIIPISAKDVQGPTQGEFQIMQELLSTIDRQTVGQVAAGQDPSGSQTATQVIEVQRQAKLLANQTEAAAVRLEWKLAWQRTYLLLENWFKPSGTKVQGGTEVTKYPVTNIQRPIQGQGMGRRVTVPTKDLPSPDEVFNLEEEITKATGIPHRFIFIDPDTVTDSRIVFRISIIPKQKRTSELAKIMFDTMLTGIERLTKLGVAAKPEQLAESFGMVWDVDPEKMFGPAAPQPVPPTTGGPVAPGITPPSPQGALAQPIKNAIQ